MIQLFLVILLMQLNFQAKLAEGLNSPEVQEQLLGEQTPDISSLVTQCSNIQAKFPPPNSYTCYHTTIKQDGLFRDCEAELIREGEISVVRSNENYTIMMVHTPGRLQDQDYINGLLCRWDIWCPNNQLMYFVVAEQDIEPRRKSSFFMQEVCVDYLKLYRDSGMEISCGQRENYANLEPRNLRVEFRSNNRFRYPGFKLRIACFNPTLQDNQGCSQSTHSLDPVRKRREQSQIAQRPTITKKSIKQALKPFTHLQPLKSNRFRRQTDVEQILINQNSNLQFGSTNLLITESGSVTDSVEGIQTLHTYNSLDGLISYYGNQREKVVIRGGGLLTVQRSIGVAYYYLYGVDPKFNPPLVERDAIYEMLKAEESLAVDDDFVIEEKEVTSTETPVLDRTPEKVVLATDTPPQLSQASTSNKGLFEASVVNSAISGANSCSAVVRAVSESVLDLIK